MARAAHHAQRAQSAMNALHQYGHETLSSLVDDMLEFDMFQYKDRRQIALALLAKESHGTDLIQDQDFRQLLCQYSSRVADEEMAALVVDPLLRLPVQKVNPDSLDTFDPKTIA